MSESPGTGSVIELEFDTAGSAGAPLGDIAASLVRVDDLLRDLGTIAAYPSGPEFREVRVVAIELLAVCVIAVGVVYAVGSFVIARSGNRLLQGYNRQFRARLGNSLLIGLEILVAADIIRTVALEPTLTNVAILGILVLVRTFLSWSLVVEIEGRWPWQRPGSGKTSAQDRI